MNVLVYTGPDTSSPSLSHTLTSLRTLLTPNYAVQTLDAKALPTQPWPASCALLIIPPFQSQSGAGAFSAAAAKDVQNYVRGGGKLLSLGNAVRVDPSKIPTALALSAQVAGVSISDVSPTPASAPRPKLTLEDGDVGLAFSLAPVTEGIVDAPAIRLVDGAQLDGVQSAGGVDLPTLPEAALSAKGVEFLAQYDPTEDSCVVAIKARIGRGVAAFWGAHLEAPLASDPARDKARLQALRRTLDLLGLRLPSPSAAGESDNGAVARPTPQILSSAPWRIGVVETILRALEVPELAAAAPYEFKDSNDTFLFHPQQEAARVFAEQREATKTLGEDPATWNPKHIVVYKDGMTAPQELTPKFRIETYYEELRNARGERGCPENYPDGAWGVGEALLYGEVVTSTQTMLDKNIRLLTSLPTPLLSLASAQLTGRGRGGNVWLSPPGCLQFSLLLRAPLSALPATKIVFVQYLFALAVAEACRTDGVLGEEAGSRVRIKWPNDLYAITPDGERKKIGGILVNTSFGAGKVELVVGASSALRSRRLTLTSTPTFHRAWMNMTFTRSCVHAACPQGAA
ncbi:hypothetical protein DICSQDRAFT_136396 [Dichomitus squalens LYAD-421 SS1]|uniref:BPL/LPL catalytic domain-containing protein n=1 Tax=Dichomitus squalens (strain LYAD-421) TaxID=732165 RepID=R7T2Q6_DICSQ|nr:uncharacterized protein DICSQDRAFT_136396 [Dichomitus squalens LYAD-421 SS1]EJF61872.1 hypothetical protein DICSQDRAFT_136396 [Dichomitus squalens LYAD-421 SS1]